MSNMIKATGLKTGINILRSECKVFKLPSYDELNRWHEDGEFVELLLLDYNQYSIECYEFPIKFGNYFGNRVFFNTMMDKFNINPKFIFDGEKKQWVLFNSGYVCFAELEIEHKSNHKLYGDQNA